MLAPSLSLQHSTLALDRQIWYPGEPDYSEWVCGNARDDAPQFIPGKIGN
jgi:hypothetical protein